MAGIGPFSRRLRDRPDDQLPLPRRTRLQRRVRPRRRSGAGPCGQRADPGVDRRGGAAGRASTAAASCRAPGPWPRHSPSSSWPAAPRRRRRIRRRGSTPGHGGPVQGAAAGGHGRLPAGVDRFGVHLRRAHAPRDPDRPVGRRRSRDDVARPLHAPGRVHRRDPARLRGPGELPARPLPGQRHDDGDAHRRPELGPVQRPDPVPRGAADPADHGGPDRRRRQPAAGGEHHRPQRRPRRAPRSTRCRARWRPGRRPRSRCTRPGARAARATRCRTPPSGSPPCSTRTTSG